MNTDTPRTDAALAATLDAGFNLGPEHKLLVELCREMEAELASKPDAAPAIDERQAFEAWARRELCLPRSISRAWLGWQARASSAAPAGLSEMNAVQGHEAGRATQGARTGAAVPPSADERDQ